MCERPHSNVITLIVNNLDAHEPLDLSHPGMHSAHPFFIEQDVCSALQYLLRARHCARCLGLGRR